MSSASKKICIFKYYTQTFSLPYANNPVNSNAMPLIKERFVFLLDQRDSRALLIQWEFGGLSVAGCKREMLEVLIVVNSSRISRDSGCDNCKNKGLCIRRISRKRRKYSVLSILVIILHEYVANNSRASLTFLQKHLFCVVV